MKKLFNLSASLLMIAFVVSSCGKYEEGPAISLRSKKARVANTWQVEKIYYDGKEQDASFFSGLQITMDKDGSHKTTFGGMTVSEGTWEFSDDNTELVVTDSDGDKTSSTIIKLHNKELWLQEEDSVGNELVVTEMHLKGLD